MSVTSRNCSYEGKNNEIKVFKSGRLTLVGKRNQKYNIIELVQTIPIDPIANLCAEFLLSNPTETDSFFVVASTPLKGSSLSRRATD